MIHASTLAELIDRASADYRDRPAFIWRPGFRALRFAYEEIGMMAKAFANLLEKQGIQKGDRVILWAVNSPYWVAAFFGCQLKGAVAVPLMVGNTPDFVKLIAEVTEAKLLVKTSAFRNEGLPVIPTIGLETTLQDYRSMETDFTRPEISPDDICELMFTSGTTGNPKGVVIKHRNILANVEDIERLQIVNNHDHLLSFLPLAHSFEQVASLFTAVAKGLTVTQAASLAGLHIRMIMVEDQPTVMVSVPEFLKLAMQQIEAKAAESGRSEKLRKLFHLAPRLPQFLRRRLSRQILERFGGRLRLIVSGGSALDAVVGDKWEALGVTVIQGYGATECSPVISANRIKDRKSGSVGFALPSVEVKLAEDGEILVKGPNVVDGYYKRPEETDARFKEGWYHTDDLGAFDEDGHLLIRGRKKFLIVTPAGENVYPEDIENLLNQQPEVKDSAALAWEPDGRFEIHAVLLPKSGVTISDPKEIVRRVNSSLQPHQQIQGSSAFEGEDFPRTVTRKVKKNEVKAWLESLGKPEAEGSGHQAGEVEKLLAQVTGFQADQIRPEMHLESDLRIDSLGRVTLVGLVEEEMGIALDEAAINAETTVADLKQRILNREQKQERYEFNTKPLSTRSVFLRKMIQNCLLWPYVSYLNPRVIVEGVQNLAALNGPALIYPNHLSPVDAAIVMRHLPAKYRSYTAIAAAADIAYENSQVTKYLPLLELILNIYPFQREGQIKSSLQYTGRLLDRGYSIMLFPEGRMSPDGALLPIKPGAGLIAAQVQAPVIPVVIEGTQNMVPYNIDRVVLPKRAKIKITYGAPFTVPVNTPPEEAAAMIRESIAELQR